MVLTGVIHHDLLRLSNEMEKTTFYRLANTNTCQGLWYDFKGKFTGHIHGKFNFCKNSELLMEFDEELIGFLSATKSLDDIFHWFSVEDILKLQKHNYFIHQYESDNYKFYDRFQHWVIHQETVVFKHQIILKCDDSLEIKKSTDDAIHLEWLFNRLVDKHGENPNYDYMHKLKNIINKLG